MPYTLHMTSFKPRDPANLVFTGLAPTSRSPGIQCRNQSLSCQWDGDMPGQHESALLEVPVPLNSRDKRESATAVCASVIWSSFLSAKEAFSLPNCVNRGRQEEAADFPGDTDSRPEEVSAFRQEGRSASCAHPHTDSRDPRMRRHRPIATREMRRCDSHE